MKANDYQVGGVHYHRSTYQPWDFICDAELHYLLGCAVKYIVRHWDKGGAQDLRKALHYIAKAEEKGVLRYGRNLLIGGVFQRFMARIFRGWAPGFSRRVAIWNRFEAQLPKWERDVLVALRHGDTETVKYRLDLRSLRLEADSPTPQTTPKTSSYRSPTSR